MFSAKKKIYLLVLVLCLADVLLFSLILLPLVRKIQIHAKDLNVQKNNLAVLTAQSGGLDALQENVDKLKKYSQLVQAAFIESSAPVQFMEFLEKQAENYPLLLTASLSDPAAVKSDLWSAIGVRVDIEGKLADCLRFVETLENSHWVVIITRLDLRKLSPKEGASEASLSLDLKAFSGKPAVLKKNF